MTKEDASMDQITGYTPAALYARVSSDRQDVDLSVAAQLRALRDYAKKNGYMVAREYIDEAESGRIADRPQFKKMIDEAAKPEAPFKEILVWKFSRFTRKREHAVAFKSMLRRKGVRVVSITEQADDSPTGKLLEGIIESVDEFYSENLAQEVTRGMREAASRGFWVASRTPYGYDRVMVQDGAKKRPVLEPDPDASDVVKRIFNMAEAGTGMLEISKTLNDEGIASPAGKRWSKNTVHCILRERGLYGHPGLGHRRQGQGRAGTGGEGVPSHRLQDQVPASELADADPCSQGQTPPQGGKHLSSQRAGQVQGVQQGAQRPGRQERPVLLLRLPVDHETRQGSLQHSEAQRPPVRGVGRRQDSLQRPHRLQHPGPLEGGGRADGQREPRAAREAGDHRRDELEDVKGKHLGRIWHFIETETDKVDMPDAADHIREK